MSRKNEENEDDIIFFVQHLLDNRLQVCPKNLSTKSNIGCHFMNISAKPTRLEKYCF